MSTIPQPVRLNALLARLGLCSVGEADRFLEQGLVLLNGAVTSKKIVQIQEVCALDLAPRAKAIQTNKTTLVLHKPINYATFSGGEQSSSMGPGAPAKNGRLRFPSLRKLLLRENNVELCAPAVLKTHWEEVRRTNGGEEQQGGAHQNFFRAARARQKKKSVFNPSQLKDLYVADAALDASSSGLIVLTQDGRVASRLAGRTVGGGARPVGMEEVSGADQHPGAAAAGQDVAGDSFGETSAEVDASGRGPGEGDDDRMTRAVDEGFENAGDGEKIEEEDELERANALFASMGPNVVSFDMGTTSSSSRSVKDPSRTCQPPRPPANTAPSDPALRGDHLLATNMPPLEREYHILATQRVFDSSLSILKAPLNLRGLSLPRLETVRRMGPQKLAIVTAGGQDHVVTTTKVLRKMCALAGVEVESIQRVRIGKLSIADLPVGKWRVLARPMAEIF